MREIRHDPVRDGLGAPRAVPVGSRRTTAGNLPDDLEPELRRALECGRERAIEGLDLAYVVAATDRQMDQIAGSQLRVAVGEDPCRPHVFRVKRKHRRNAAPGESECGVERLPTADRNVGMEKFLEDFGGTAKGGWGS